MDLSFSKSYTCVEFEYLSGLPFPIKRWNDFRNNQQIIDSKLDIDAFKVSENNCTFENILADGHQIS